MDCCDLHLTVQEDEAIALEIVEAVIKPEQSKTVTPTYAEQTIMPDPGMTLGSVTVEPIPDPTERLTITENGSFDVARIGGVDVNVPQGVFPTGTFDITENGTFDVTNFIGANVNVPVEWVAPSGQARLVTQRVTLTEDYSGQATAFIPIVTALAGIDASNQGVVVTTLALVSVPQTPATNEIRELVIGYTSGLRFKRTYWNGSKWVTAIATNTYFNVAAKAGSVYELVGFEM